MPRTTRKNTVYYAHAMCLYGHPDERKELRMIKDAFPDCKIINPCAYEDHPDKRRDVLGFCFQLIDTADGLVFSRLLGKITAGVGAEVNHALKIGKAVFELQDNESDWEVVRVKKPVRYISRPATRDLYRTFRQADY